MVESVTNSRPDNVDDDDSRLHVDDGPREDVSSEGH